MKGQGFLVLLVGPSGVGKNTLLASVLQRIPDLVQLPTATTRPPRSGEVNGREHFFLSGQEFDSLRRSGAFVEAQAIHGNWYGTLRSTLDEGIVSGRDYIADIDPLGAMTLKDRYTDSVVLVFIRPPNMDVLETRIRQRGDISEEELAARLSRAYDELQYAQRCKYVIVNDDLSGASTTLQSVILRERDLREGKRNRTLIDRLRRR